MHSPVYIFLTASLDSDYIVLILPPSHPSFIHEYTPQYSHLLVTPSSAILQEEVVNIFLAL